MALVIYHEYQNSEDIRSTLRARGGPGAFRESLPTGSILWRRLRSGRRLPMCGQSLRISKQYRTPKVTKIAGSIDLRTREEEAINIQPIQAAGRLTTEARKALISYGHGDSSATPAANRSGSTKSRSWVSRTSDADLAKFVNMDHARVVPGARRGFQAVTGTLVKKGDAVIVSALAHYTEFLAVENAGGVVKEVPLNGQNIVTGKQPHRRSRRSSRRPENSRAATIDHFDYQFANEHEIEEIGKVAHQYDIPFLYNGAYTVGVMPGW